MNGKRLFKGFIYFIILPALITLTACGSTQSVGSSAKGDSSKASDSGSKKETNADKKTNFPTKDIKIVVPYSPGGGNDIMARLVASLMEKHLPNPVKVIIENKPGGDSMIGLNAVYKAKPDGYTLGVSALPGNFVKQVLGEAEYDLTKVDYVGYIANTSYVAAASKKSGFTKMEDLQKAKEVVAGIGSISSTDGLGVLIAADKMGIKVRTISHKGSKEAILSAVRGDSSWVQMPIESILPSVIDSKELVPLWVYAEHRLPELPNTPTIVELGHKELLESIALHRVMFSTPGTPKEVLAVLRDTFQKSVNDPEFKKKVEEMKAEWNPNDYQFAEKAANGALKQLEPFKEILKNNQ